MAELAPTTFLRRTPPFDALSERSFREGTRALEVGFFPKGNAIARAGGEPLKYLHIIRKGAVRISRGRQTLEILEEGETFGYTSLLTGTAGYDVFAEEDLLAYLLPKSAFDSLLRDAAFAAYYASGLSDRLRQTLERTATPAFQTHLAGEVGSLVRRPPVFLREDASVKEAARAMREAGVSSVILRSDPPAIVTDRDLRNRVLAERRGAALPAMAVASRPLSTLDAKEPVHAAWAALLDAGMNHLPLTRNGEIVGVVTTTDLMRASVAGPMSVLEEVERLSSRQELAGHGRRLASLADALLAGGLDPPAVGVFAARLDEALIGRILSFANRELGPAPLPFALVVFGPEGRMERPLAAEHDHALVLPDAADLTSRSYFERLALAIDGDLETAGFEVGRGHKALSIDTLSGFCKMLERARVRPPVAETLLDARRVAGTLDVGPLMSALASLAKDPVFMKGLKEAALYESPGVKLGDVPIDLETAGIAPLVRLARAESLAAGAEGLSARSTLERMSAIHRAGRLSKDRFNGVAQAFRFLWAQRLSCDLTALAEGRAPTSKVLPASLSSADRAGLKDAFRAVRGWQRKVSRLGGGGP